MVKKNNCRLNDMAVIPIVPEEESIDKNNQNVSNMSSVGSLLVLDEKQEDSQDDDEKGNFKVEQQEVPEKTV